MWRNHGHSSFLLRLGGVWFTWTWQLLRTHPVDADSSDSRLRARGSKVVSTTPGRSRCWLLLETADILASQTFSFEASAVLSTLLDWWLLDGNYHVLDVLVFLRHWNVIALPTPLGNFRFFSWTELSELSLCAEGFLHPAEQQKAHSRLELPGN